MFDLTDGVNIHCFSIVSNRYQQLTLFWFEIYYDYRFFSTFVTGPYCTLYHIQRYMYPLINGANIIDIITRYKYWKFLSRVVRN